MGINTEDNMETKLRKQYGGADGPAAAPASASANGITMEANTAAISPAKKDRTWPEVLELLQTTHTICMRDICQQLKSSRTWVARYIMPYLDKLYLDTGFRGNKMTTKSWTKTAAIMLNDNKYLANSLWCNEEQFDRLIRNHVVSVTKQTKSVPVELLVKNKHEFAKEYNKIAESISKKEADMRYNGYDKEIMRLLNAEKKQLEAIVEKHMSDTGKMVRSKGATLITKRSNTIPVNVPLPETSISDWRALHDEKSYGDTDESVLRDFFQKGCIRVEVCIPDPKEIKEPAAIYDFDKYYNEDTTTATISATIHVKSVDEIAINSIANSDVEKTKGYHRETIQEQIMESKSLQEGIKCSQKIYYIDDPAPIKHQYVDKYVTISEKVWQQYEKILIP